MTASSLARDANRILRILSSSATALAAALRAGEFSAREVVEAHIEHMERVNPGLNAVVVTRFREARAEADRADVQLAAARAAGSIDSLPPLLGVPCTIKENFELEGTPQASGLVSRQHIINDSDAITVARLRAAGAIPLGVSNTSELCMWMESYNEVYGRSNNPYDPARIVGGSSGGEGAIIGAGASPFGLGADVGGSIRMPAFFNGVFGHKCSPRLVPNEGQYPGPQGGIDDFLSTGPLCRRAEDLEPLLRIMAGPAAGRLKDVASVDIKGLRVLVLAPDRGPRARRDMREAQARAVQALQEAGARVESIDLPLLDKGFDIWSSMLATAEGPSFAEMMFGSRSVWRPLREFGRLLTGRSPHTLPLVILAALEKVPELAPGRARKFVALGVTLKQQIEEALGDDGVLVTLPYTEVAPKHGKPLFPPFNWVRCAIFNAMSVPSTSVPMGLNAEGLPLGVQIVAAQDNDHLSLACALELERRIGGWVPPWTRPALR
ncbi:MAG: Glutamyl-tRNA(Gln) amidotransferase subunit [Moraxellaceae bacterium]|jgi:fatty acid amide hydrolase 2|nr:Glutamyl-tRNA(Gln) amidotransferase subunit [Moraxellaceae bacterium]